LWRAQAVLTIDVGTADAEGATFLTFTQTFRRCDYSTNTHIGLTGFARPTAVLRSTGSEIIADVQIATTISNTAYDVRVIEMPRSSASGCNAGNPGVIAGVLMTDPAGAGSVTLRSPVASNATGAWMFIGRPGELAQTPDEFYLRFRRVGGGL
jgi:hypothetical protein